MPPLKVFVSHSAHSDAEATELLKAIEARLLAEKDPQGGARFAPRVDWTDLQPGQPWRSEINTWLEHCDAAVALLSLKAQNSAFVAHELSVLSHRRSQNDKFLLQPIFLTGITFNNVNAGGFAPVQIGEIHPIRHDPANIQKTVDEVLAELMPLQAGLVEPDRQTLEVARLLKKIDPQILKPVVPDFGVRVGPWDSVQDQEQRLAMILMSMDLTRARRIIEKLNGDWWNEKDLRSLYYLVAVRWVDPQAASIIPQVRDWACGNRNLCLDIAGELVAKLFVLRALGFPAANAWFFAPVNTIFGECDLDNDEEAAAFFKDLVQKVRAALKKNMDTTDEELAKDLIAFDGDRKPVFVSMAALRLPDKFLKALRNDFSTVTYFFRTRNYIKNAIRPGPPVVVWMSPGVDPLDEESFLEEFDSQWRLLRPRPRQI